MNKANANSSISLNVSSSIRFLPAFINCGFSMNKSRNIGEREIRRLVCTLNAFRELPACRMVILVDGTELALYLVLLAKRILLIMTS